MKPNRVQQKLYNSATYRRDIKRSIEGWKAMNPCRRVPADIKRALHYFLEPMTFEETNRRRQPREDAGQNNSIPHDSIKY